MADPPDRSAPFNMAMLYYTEFHHLRLKKQEAMLQNELPFAYECLEEMYTMVSFKLDETQKDSIEKRIKLLRKKIPVVRLPEKIMIKIRTEFKDLMRELDREIMVFMDKYNMIFPKIEVKGGLPEFEKAMGIHKG